MAKLPKLVKGAQYGPETLNQYRPGNKNQGKIVRRPDDTGPHWYQPKNQSDYDSWMARGDRQDAEIDAKRGVASAKEAIKSSEAASASRSGSKSSEPASIDVDNSGLTKEKP